MHLEPSSDFDVTGGVRASNGPAWPAHSCSARFPSLYVAEVVVELAEVQQQQALRAGPAVAQEPVSPVQPKCLSRLQQPVRTLMHFFGPKKAASAAAETPVEGSAAPKSGIDLLLPLPSPLKGCSAPAGEGGWPLRTGARSVLSGEKKYPQAQDVPGGYLRALPPPIFPPDTSMPNFAKGTEGKVFGLRKNAGNGTMKNGYSVPFFSHSPPPLFSHC